MPIFLAFKLDLIQTNTILSGGVNFECLFEAVLSLNEPTNHQKMRLATPVHCTNQI